MEACWTFFCGWFGKKERDKGIEIEKAGVTPFAYAGFLGKMSFWWLNPLVKQGKNKTLQPEDIPRLRREDQAETCYSTFMEQLEKQRRGRTLIISSTLVLQAIISCQWKDILISGFCAMVKVVTLSTGPLFLRAFILVAQGKESFKHQGYVLTAGLFSAKCLESLSQRQWYFRTRLIGLQVRSSLSAAIYQKQLKISNTHSPGEIMNYVTSDAYRIGEFPYWFHQIWSTSLQVCLALAIMYYSVGLATFTTFFIIVLMVVGSSPMAKREQQDLRKLTVAQDQRLKAIAESLGNMKILKLYAWEKHFKDVITKFRRDESKWIEALLTKRGYSLMLFWSSTVLIPAATFWTCYLLRIPLTESTVFMFLACIQIVQEPMRLIPESVAAFIQAKVSLSRIVDFLNAPELQNKNARQLKYDEHEFSLLMESVDISWDETSPKPSLRNINLSVKSGEKVAICGEVGSGKSTLLSAILGEVPYIKGTVRVITQRRAYVSQTAWIQTGTIQENILFGSSMDPVRYQQVLDKCSLVKDIEMLPFRDMTVIGERGVNLSGGQKQRIQLARALYQDADVYLLDDPFSAVDAQTASSLFKDYVMGALARKMVLLATHQVDFLPAFNSILFMSSGEISSSGSYNQLMTCCKEFQDLVNAHKTTAGSVEQVEVVLGQRRINHKQENEENVETCLVDQLIKEEEREIGDKGLKPYFQYLRHKKGFLYFTLVNIIHACFLLGQVGQSYWLASNVKDSGFDKIELNTVYTAIAFVLVIFLIVRSLFVVRLGCDASESICSTLLSSLFRAGMSFYDSTPLGRILSRVSSDLSLIDVDMAFRISFTLGSILSTLIIFAVLAFLSWPVVFVIAPTIYLTVVIQKYYNASSRELVRMDGTTKSVVASHLAESIAGAITIRAFQEQDRFFSESLQLIDANASAYFHNFAANEWLIQRLELLCAIVLSSAALAITLLNRRSYASGFIGMELAYGLSLNMFLVSSVQFQCILSNLIISVERVEQYMHIESEAPEVIEETRPTKEWPAVGSLKICNLKVRYRPGAPLVLRGINCKIEGGDKVGIVGRTGSGKTTLISTLFRLVEPTQGKIIVDGVDITTIGLHDLRSHFGIIPQDPTLFGGTVRYNLDPLSEHTNEEIWQVLVKCQLREAVREKGRGLDSPVLQDGSNWSVGQRQLFCLGRALLKRRRILVLDEATASIDNATDSILQQTIRTEFADCTVITVAHRIPTVMACTMVLGMSDGKMVEYDEPTNLINKEGSLFGQLSKEYWSRTVSASSFLE